MTFFCLKYEGAPQVSFLSSGRHTPGLLIRSMAMRPFIQQLAFNRAKSFFSLGIDPIARGVQSKFNIWYLDDASFGEEPMKVLADLQNVIS